LPSSPLLPSQGAVLSVDPVVALPWIPNVRESAKRP
jgi:hypothetical protein